MIDKPMEIVKVWEHIYVVKIARKYYVVGHDAVTCETFGVHPSDRDKETKQFRRVSGWNKEAIEAVSKGHKKDGGYVYWTQAIRNFKRQRLKDVLCDNCNSKLAIDEHMSKFMKAMR